MIKIWVDDERPMPEGYDFHYKSVWETIIGISYSMGFRFDEPNKLDILLDLDHDAGEYSSEGGDYIQILKAMSMADALFFGHPLKVHFHSANPVGVKNMRAIVEKNHPWMEEV